MPPKSQYPSHVCLNGEILPAGEAKISVFDRGFLFGDGIYEVMAQINGKFFYKEAHMARLRRCLREIDIDQDVDALERDIPALLGAAGLSGQDCLLYLQVTRGVAPRQHAYPAGVRPTTLMYAWPRSLPDINHTLAATVTREDFRWSRCDIKMTSLLGNVMANQFAMEEGCYETLFVRGGLITEASHCNVFFAKEGVVFTHPANNFILDGITRQVVLELCAQLGIEVHQEGIRASDLCNMDEAFLTGTSTQVMAIGTIDGKAVGCGIAGPVTRKIQEAFLDKKRTSR